MEEKRPRLRGPRLRRTGERAQCRFCSRLLPRPKKRDYAPLSLLPGGKCRCGAAFVVDPTGRNGGIALMEALEDAAGGDKHRSVTMIRHRDYEDFIENYEPHAHRYIVGFKGYRRGMARIYLVKLNEEPPPDSDPPA